jgi:hypothetical protein
MNTKTEHGNENRKIPSDALQRLFALMDERNTAKAQQDARERREREDRKLARLKPWWLEAHQ